MKSESAKGIQLGTQYTSMWHTRYMELAHSATTCWKLSLGEECKNANVCVLTSKMYNN